MKREEAIEIIIEATKGNARKEDFFKLPNEIIGDVLDEYAKSINKNSVIHDVVQSTCCNNPNIVTEVYTFAGNNGCDEVAVNERCASCGEIESN